MLFPNRERSIASRFPLLASGAPRYARVRALDPVQGAVEDCKNTRDKTWHSVLTRHAWIHAGIRRRGLSVSSMGVLGGSSLESARALTDSNLSYSWGKRSNTFCSCRATR